MAQIFAIAYNPSSELITGTQQIGALAVSTYYLNYSDNYGGVQWWSTPDLDLRYVICYPVPEGDHPTSIPGVTASIGFWGSEEKTDQSFLHLANNIPPRKSKSDFISVSEANDWLYNNGYWSSYEDNASRLPGPEPQDCFIYKQCDGGPNIIYITSQNASQFPVGQWFDGNCYYNSDIEVVTSSYTYLSGESFTNCENCQSDCLLGSSLVQVRCDLIVDIKVTGKPLPSNTPTMTPTPTPTSPCMNPDVVWVECGLRPVVSYQSYSLRLEACCKDYLNTSFYIIDVNYNFSGISPIVGNVIIHNNICYEILSYTIILNQNNYIMEDGFIYSMISGVNPCKTCTSNVIGCDGIVIDPNQTLSFRACCQETVPQSINLVATEPITINLGEGIIYEGECYEWVQNGLIAPTVGTITQSEIKGSICDNELCCEPPTPTPTATMTPTPTMCNDCKGVNIVFSIDVTSGMDTYINNAKSQISQLTELITLQVPDYKFGLVTFDDGLTYNPNYQTSFTYLSLPSDQKIIDQYPNNYYQYHTCLRKLGINNENLFLNKFNQLNTGFFVMGDGNLPAEPINESINYILNGFAGQFDGNDYEKYIVVLTDALPGGSNEIFDPEDVDFAINTLQPELINNNIKLVLLTNNSNVINNSPLVDVAEGTGGIAIQTNNPINSLIEYLEPKCCIPPTPTPTNTSTPTPTNSFDPVLVECLTNIIIETIYIKQSSDVSLMNSLNPYNYPTYENPCFDSSHTCGRALSFIYGNDEFIGYSNLNNEDQTNFCDAVTDNGILIYQDNYTPYINQTISSWTSLGGNQDTRYNRLTIDLETATNIAINTPEGSTYVDFELVYALDVYDVTCNYVETTPHTNLTWIRVIREEEDGSFNLIYNGCPENNIATVSVCEIVPNPTPTPNTEDPFNSNCDAVLTHFPATINGVDITVEMTGDASQNNGSLNVCYPSGMLTSYWTYGLGQTGSFTITFNFSTPVNNVKFKLAGTGQVNNNTGNETFIVTTNGGGSPSIVSPLNCHTTINGNIILSGAGFASSWCPSCDGGGGLFIVNNNNPYTSFTISGPGGLQGSVVSLCQNFTIV